jgi:hypothetical protein
VVSGPGAGSRSHAIAAPGPEASAAAVDSRHSALTPTGDSSKRISRAKSNLVDQPVEPHDLAVDIGRRLADGVGAGAHSAGAAPL